MSDLQRYITGREARDAEFKQRREASQAEFEAAIAAMKRKDSQQ